MDGATEIARTDIARPSKLWGLNSRDWTTRDHIARVDIAKLDNLNREGPDSRAESTVAGGTIRTYVRDDGL